MCHRVVCWVGINVSDKPDTFIFMVDYKATQKNVVHYPNYFFLFCVSCALFLCMVWSSTLKLEATDFSKTFVSKHCINLEVRHPRCVVE